MDSGLEPPGPMLAHVSSSSHALRLDRCTGTIGRVTVLIDPPVWPGRGRLWSHLVSDQSYDELHAFAERLGAPRRGFDRDHYDVPADAYSEAISQGAQAVSSRELVRRLTEAGLRRRKTRASAPSSL